MAAELDDDGRRLLACLVSYLSDVRPGDPLSYFTYNDVHDKKLVLRRVVPNVGESLKRQGLKSLADWTDAESLPMITGVIVRESDHQPGDGYFTFFKGAGSSRDDWWHEQIRLSKEFDWTPFIGGTPPPPPPTTPEASDLVGPPPRVEITEYRVLRDSEVARRVKVLHGYRCQVCGEVIRLPNGRFYAEAHHIQPLGGKHQGHDVKENVLCLCPNHHAEMDLGLRDIDITALTRVRGHVIGPEYVRYHNDVIRSRWK